MELDAVLAWFADNLRAERARAGLTLDQLADRCALSTAHLSRLESGERQPSVAALITLSRSLGTSVGALLGEGAGDAALGIYPGASAEHTANGLAVSVCSGFPGSSGLEALRIVVIPDRIPPSPARHRGEEWVHVVSGRLRLEFGDQVHLLDAGSSAHFDAEVPHLLGAVGGPTEVLVVAAERTGGPRHSSFHPSPTLGHWAGEEDQR